MAKTSVDQLLAQLDELSPEAVSKYKTPNKHYCEIYNRDFYFLHDTFALSEIVNNDRAYKTQEQKIAAQYAVYLCDADGRQLIKGANDRRKFIDGAFKKPQFYDHALGCMIGVGLWKQDGDETDAAEEAIVAEKKGSSATTSSG